MDTCVPFVGRETTLQAFGRDWTLSRWDLAIWDPFLAWAREQLPDPLEVAERACTRIDLKAQDLAEQLGRMQQTDPRGRKADFDATYKRLHHQFETARNQQELLYQIALREASDYLSPNNPRVQSLISSPRGMARLLYLLLLKNHSDVTEDQAWAIVQALPQGVLGQAFQIVQGKLPPAAPDPNASGLAATSGSPPVVPASTGTPSA